VEGAVEAEEAGVVVGGRVAEGPEVVARAGDVGPVDGDVGARVGDARGEDGAVGMRGGLDVDGDPRRAVGRGPVPPLLVDVAGVPVEPATAQRQLLDRRIVARAPDLDEVPVAVDEVGPVQVVVEDVVAQGVDVGAGRVADERRLRRREVDAV
jgi:hypothetical protein